MFHKRLLVLSSFGAGLLLLIGLTSMASNARAWVAVGPKWANPLSVRYASQIQIFDLTTAFYNARGVWNASTSHMYLTPDTGSPQVIGYSYTSADGNNGYSELHWSGTYFTQNYLYLNWNYLQYDTASRRQGTAGHEWGHCVGLDHEYSLEVLMNPNRNRDNTYIPQPDDIMGISAIYP